jgi:hypothetical protein
MAQISPHTRPSRDLVVFVLSVGLLGSSLGRAAADFGNALAGLTPAEQQAFVEPRVKKRRPKSFPLMLKLRQALRQQLVQQKIRG